MAYSYTITQEMVVSGFHALSDPLRVQIIELLRNLKSYVFVT